MICNSDNKNDNDGGSGGSSTIDFTLLPQTTTVGAGRPIGEVDTSPGSTDTFSATASYTDAYSDVINLDVDVEPEDGGVYEVVLDPSTIIEQPGSYNVNLSVTDQTTGDSASVVSQIVATDGALQVTGAPPPIYEPADQSFTATVATVSNGDPNLQASNLQGYITWGDGPAQTPATFTAVPGSPGVFTISGTHTYANANPAGQPYTVTAYVNEISDPDNCDAGQTAIDTSLPTIKVFENGSTHEADGANSMETFTITRSSLSGALTVPLIVGGTAVEGVNYTFANVVGGITNDTITFADMQSSVIVKVVPIDDGVAGWTKTVTISIAPPTSGSGGGGSGGSSSPTYQVDPNHGSATGTIGDSDLAVTLGDPGDGSSPTIQGSPNGDQNLKLLSLNAPYITLPGQTVTLSVSRPDIVRVWDKEPDGTMDPIIGVESTYTWTYSADGSTNFVPPLLYVGATDGSSAMGDIQFTLTDSDLQSTVGGATGSPPEPSTYNVVDSNAGQAVRVYIKSNDDPNSVGNTADWSGLTQTWYVGQYVDLAAEIRGPAALIASSSFTWNVPGSPLSDYKISSTSAQTVPLTTENTRQPEVHFLWPVAWGGSESDTVTVTAAGLSLPTPITASTTFNVVVPSQTFEVASLGNVQFGNGGTTVGLYSMPGVPGTFFAMTQQNAGIVFEGTVGGPSGGTWELLQTLNGSIGFQSTTGWELDNKWPYNNYLAVLPADNKPQLDSDGPEMVLTTRIGVLLGIEDDIFNYEMYQMYKPPGNQSRYVALSYIYWHAYMTAKYSITNGWTLPAARNGQGASSESDVGELDAAAEPVYSAVWKNSE